MNQSVGRVKGPQQTTPWPRRSSRRSNERTVVHHHSYPDRATARRSIFEWLIGYNTHRLHTSLGNQTARRLRTPLPSHRGHQARLNHLHRPTGGSTVRSISDHPSPPTLQTSQIDTSKL